MIHQAVADLFLFSSDYPHIEGGRKRLKALQILYERYRRGRQGPILRTQFRRIDGVTDCSHRRRDR
jgi:hypothetical protein